MDKFANSQSGTGSSPATLTSLLSDLDGQLDRLGKVASALLLISDRVHGSEPRPTEGSPGASAPGTSAGLIQDLTRRHERMKSLLSICEDHLARIERGL
jgi:hypothetical protein